MGFKHYIKLMRPHQWYKNLLVVLPILFVDFRDPLPAIFNLANYPPLILGFIAFCAVSSAGYIFNDVKDVEEDAAHPEKRNRPLPSGDVSRQSALVIGAGLMIGGITLSFINSTFFLLIIMYIINSQAYNYFLRNYAVVDVVTIGIGFIIRAIAGTFLIGVEFTSWLILGVFFVALVLGFSKRKNELYLLGDEAAQHKKVFTQYNNEFLNHAVASSATWLVIFYTLYVYQNFGEFFETQPVILTVPVVAGLVLRYVFLVFIGHPIGRKPHLAIKDKGMFVGFLIFGAVLAITILRIGDETIWTILFNFLQSIVPPPPIIP
ncbi:MAG: UbiA prenyltransferase family protein [Candidatus Thorarchaeota archaeon]|nr:UbiA prenyltransferase family protein [Candidatus Thorarchaeota archaeon]